MLAHGTTTWTQSGQRAYVLGPLPDERLIVMEGRGAGRVVSYPHTDRRGSTVALSQAGQAVETYAYDAFGRGRPDDGPAGYPFRYTGQRLDPWTGTYHYKAREYSPQLGRFLQPDPARFVDGPNVYAYVGNNPWNATDPTGMEVYLATRQVTPGFWYPTPAGIVWIPPQYHMFLVTHADYVGDPNAQVWSWGPERPGVTTNPGALIQHFMGTSLNASDLEAWVGGEMDRRGRSVRIDADDDVAAQAARNVLGHPNYSIMPWPDPGEDANSNSAAVAAARDADRASGSRPANAPTPLPTVGTPGSGQSRVVVRICPPSTSRIPRSC